MNTGIDLIDNQHKRIVDYINQLENAVRQKDSHSVGIVLDELADYCLAHFGFEESLQEKAGYALAKPHKLIHETFAKRLARYQERYDAGEDVAKQLHDMLRIWLVQHIKRDDMAYVSVVKGRIDRVSGDKNDGDWLSRSVKGFFN